LSRVHLKSFIKSRGTNRIGLANDLKADSEYGRNLQKLILQHSGRLTVLRTVEGRADNSEKAKIMFELLNLKLMLFMHHSPKLNKGREKLYTDFLDGLIKTDHSLLLDEEICSKEAKELVEKEPNRIWKAIENKIRDEEYEIAGDIRLILGLKELKDKWKNYHNFRLGLENQHLEGIELYAEIVKYFTPTIDSLYSSAHFYAKSTRKSKEKALFVLELLEILHEATNKHGGSYYVNMKNMSKELREQVYSKE
jgi:hypothetical protein